MAVQESWQGRGVGARLVRAVIDLATAEAISTVLVATASADIGNLRFYQRKGFRIRSIERDAFTPATDYPADLVIDGIRTRDRVWLDYDGRITATMSGIAPDWSRTRQTVVDSASARSGLRTSRHSVSVLDGAICRTSKRR
jgi:Acetyltransferase (GNAT) family